MHVLVVEDDARLAEALARILQDNGYATDVVHDGEAGVQYGGTGTYDVIILDVMLPKADGFTVAQRLRRAHVSTPHPAAHCPRCHQRQDLRLRLRRRRLHDQALLPRRASGPPARPHAAPGRCRLRDAHRGRPHAEPGIHGSHLRKRIHSPVAEGVRHRPHPARLAGGCAFEGAAHQPRLGPSSSASDNNVEAYISFLRKKMAHVGSKARIETIRSVGYRLAEGD